MSEGNDILTKFRNNLLLGFNSLLLAASVFFLFFFLVDQQRLNLTSLFGMTISGLYFLLSLTKYKNIGGFISLVGFNTFILIYGINIKSGYMLTILTVLLLISAFILGIWVTIFLFAVDVIGIVIGVIIGNLTLQQPIDPDVGTYYANTITDLIPVLVFGFATVLILYKALSNTINQQSEQYDLLQKTQSRLITQEKIRSIQTIAGGIAHDFNNVLTGIIGNISLITSDKNLDEETQAYLEDANKAALQGRNLANQLLTFSKKTQITKLESNVDLVSLLTNGAKIGLVGRRSKVEFELSEDLNEVSGDPNQIEQVIQNLVINADQAMDGGGIIKISADNISLPSNNDYKLPEGNYVRVCIEDEGEGIPNEIQEKIFDPFFTTKKEGTGLGLAICKIIIINHMGYIGFNTIPMNGSIFYFLLPISTRNSSKELETQDLIERKFKGSCLCLDDNPTVLNVIEKLLSRFGLEVMCSLDSTTFVEKLDELIQNERPPNLIFLDLTMPGDISGEKMVKKVRDIYPDAYVVVSSGYSDDFIMANYAEYGFNDVLSKPYTSNELGTVLQRYFSKESS